MSTPAPADLPSIISLTVGGVPVSPASAPVVHIGERVGPRPLSLTASARRITSKTAAGAQTQRRRSGASWQRDAWEMFDLIGEQRFLATTLAGQGSQARFFVGTLDDDDPLGDPIPTEDARLIGIFDELGGTPKGRAQLVARALVNYFIAGEAYYVGIPISLIPSDDTDVEAATAAPAPTPRPVDRTAPVEALRPDEATLADLRWYTLSSTEVEIVEKSAKLKLPELAGESVEIPLDRLWLIHSWRQHPERGWEADSPTRSSLPVLRELVGLTMAISAQIDSRLAGAGMLLIAQKVVDAAKVAAGIPSDSEEDPFTDALLETMSTPISDRSSAAAYAPLVVVVPGETVENAAEHVTFASPLDAELRPLREEAIRRLALGEDAPPELLLGVGSMNHWGAWLVREDVINTHITPPLAIVADSWTTKYLHPAMRAAGYGEDEISNTVVWYSVEHMIARANRSGDAATLYDKGELSGEALRRESGFDENDAPPAIGEVDPAVDLALQLIAQAPSLMQAPGLPAIVEQIRAVQAGRAATEAAADEAIATGVPAGGDAAPDRSGDAAPADSSGPPAEVAEPVGADA